MLGLGQVFYMASVATSTISHFIISVVTAPLKSTQLTFVSQPSLRRQALWSSQKRF